MRFFFAFIFTVGFIYCNAQYPNAIRAGILGKGEVNFFKFYNSKTQDDYFSIRNNFSYTLALQALFEINYLLNIQANYGFGEINYSPHLKAGSGTIYDVKLRVWNFGLGGQLNLNDNEVAKPYLYAGLQTLLLHSKTETTIGTVDQKNLWPKTRIFPDIGLGYNFYLGKKLHLNSQIGTRITKNKLGYENTFQNFYLSIGATLPLKTW